MGVQDVSDLIAVMKEHAQHEYDGGITAQENPDYMMGLAIFLEGDYEKGLTLIGKAVDVGYSLSLNQGFLQTLYDHPGFAPILAAHVARQARERKKVLTVVYNDNPHAEIWQPEEGACVRFAAESGN